MARAAEAAGVGRCGPGQGGVDSEVRADRISSQRGVLRRKRATGLVRQGLPAAGSGSSFGQARASPRHGRVV